MHLRPDCIPTPPPAVTVHQDGWALDANDGSYTAHAAEVGMSAVDRFVDRAGLRFPTPTIAGQKRKAIIISSYGQSNANVTDLGDPLMARPPMPWHTLMCCQFNANSSQ